MRVERLHLFSNKEEEKNCIQTLLRIIENYRNNTKETKKVNATEQEGIKKIMDELYTLPVAKGKKPAITEETFNTIVERIQTK
jgi:predicted GTPase